jgi:hypothetical protein
MVAMRVPGNILARFRFPITVRKYDKKDENNGLRPVNETRRFRRRRHRENMNVGGI